MFQYPQADRRGCNVLTVSTGMSLCPVSVSTSGSKGVQHQDSTPVVGVKEKFQYPQADRRGCNNQNTHSNKGGLQVSVSTSGSKGVQPRVVVRFVIAIACFSIHKRIEGGATYSRYSNLLAPEGCFSIHKRIEGGATFTDRRRRPSSKSFQYPQADRRGCNSMLIDILTKAKNSFSIHKRIEGGATAYLNRGKGE